MASASPSRSASARRRFVVVAALAEAVVLELEEQAVDLDATSGSRVRSGPGIGLGERARSRRRGQPAAPRVERRVDALVVGRALEDDRPEQLAGQGRRQLVRPELVGDAELLVRHEQQQPEQLRLDRRDGAQDLADRQRVRRGRRASVGPVSRSPRVATARRRAAMRRSRTWRSDALLDAGHVADRAGGPRRGGAGRRSRGASA